MSASYVPAGYQAINTCLIYDDVEAALLHYKKAFHSVEKMRQDDSDGALGYAEIEISGMRILLCRKDMSWYAKTPHELGGASAGLYVYVPDVDASYERALRAGMKEGTPVKDMPWGERCGGVIDVFGYGWMLARGEEE